MKDAFEAELITQGYFRESLDLPESVAMAVAARDWPALDAAMQRETSAGGVVFERLRRHAEFSAIEFIISIRSSLREPDEDGIWHDDGSRVLAFSLSVTPAAATVEGGRLEIRRRGTEVSAEIATPPFGQMIVFATGVGGFEHKINRVIGGERIIIAGWCT